MMEFTFSMKASHFFLILYLFWIKYIFSAATCSGLGQLENGRTFFRYGGILAHFACNPGFSLLGHVSSSCIQGKWRKQIPVCVVSGCRMPSGIAHGRLHVSHNNAVITVTCKKGYKPVGSSLIYCDGKRWNSTIPMCREMDMMDSSLKNKNSEIEMTFVTENSLLKKDPKGVSFNVTEAVHNNTGTAKKEKNDKNTMSSYSQDLPKVWEHQRQLHSQKTLLSFQHEKRQSRVTLKALKAEKITSIPDNHAEPSSTTKYGTSFHRLSTTATQTQNSKITERINQPSQIKAIQNLTIHGSLMEPQRKHSQSVEHELNAGNRSSVGPLKTTISNILQATQQVQSQYRSTHLANKMLSNSNANSFLPSLLKVVLETISKTIPSSSQPYNPTQLMSTTISEDAYVKANATTPAQMLSSMTSSLIISNPTFPVPLQASQTPLVEVGKTFNHTLPVQAQVIKTPIVEVEMAPNHSLPVQAQVIKTPIVEVEMAPNHSLPVQAQVIKTPIVEVEMASNHSLPVQAQVIKTPIVEVEMASNHSLPVQAQVIKTNNGNVENTISTSTDKATLIRSPNLAKASSDKIYTTQKILSASTPAATSPVMACTSNSWRNPKNVGILTKTYKRRAQCVYPPVPKHGTFRFFTIRDPPPNQYPYYIQYSCYPGYTMSAGEVYSFCMDSGEWSGLTPVCED